jgi:hypothetical protein
MIVKSVTSKNLHDCSQNSDKEYWLSKDPVERLNAVEFLRRQVYAEYPERLQRVYTITKHQLPAALRRITGQSCFVLLLS